MLILTFVPSIYISSIFMNMYSSTSCSVIVASSMFMDETVIWLLTQNVYQEHVNKTMSKFMHK